MKACTTERGIHQPRNEVSLANASPKLSQSLYDRFMNNLTPVVEMGDYGSKRIEKHFVVTETMIPLSCSQLINWAPQDPSTASFLEDE